MERGSLKAEVLEFADTLEAIEYFFERGWSDGLPVVLPTEEKVWQMIEYVGGSPGEEIAVLPPRMASATVEKVAINAVMAGCLPSYFPVVIAGVKAIARPEFNLATIQATTHSVAPLLIVNGPIVKQIGLNYGQNVFGEGWRANATIGRAIRLIMRNIGGGIPGDTDKCTMGQPGKYSYCIAENEGASPWEPLHVEHGFSPEDSTVMVFGGQGPLNIQDHVSTTARGVLFTVAGSMTPLGSNNLALMGQMLLVLGPEHAAQVANEGFSKTEVKDFLFEYARRPLWQVKGDMGKNPYLHQSGLWPKWVNEEDENMMVPAVRTPEDILVAVAGGVGRHSACVFGFGHSTRAVIERIAAPHFSLSTIH